MFHAGDDAADHRGAELLQFLVSPPSLSRAAALKQESRGTHQMSCTRRLIPGCIRKLGEGSLRFLGALLPKGTGEARSSLLVSYIQPLPVLGMSAQVHGGV